jgi:ornithine carbamoyltransferase
VKHLLSIESLSATSIEDLLQLGLELKAQRGKENHPLPLRGQTWALIFGKSSTRTRVSFEVGIQELGGLPTFLGMHDIQLGRGESVEDTARVLSRYIHGVVIRTYAQSDVETFTRVGTIPVINALTDEEHPCQILSDLMTWSEKLQGSSKVRPKSICSLFRGKTVTFFGDAACNVAQSWLFAASKLDFKLRLAAPKRFQPSSSVLSRARKADVTCFEDPLVAAKGAHVLYTDTWVSMGKELESIQRQTALTPFQINRAVVRAAAPGALVMHCLPAYRDKEITADVFEAHAQTIFDQAENRLHLQKAILTRVCQ